MTINHSEALYQILRRCPFAGKSYRELASELGCAPGPKIQNALTNLKRRRLVRFDPKTQGWQAVVMNEVAFKAPPEDSPVVGRDAHDHPPPCPVPGVTAEDLEWMREKRAQAAARQQARAAMR